MNAIEVNHLSFTYPGASRPTLEQVSLEIEKGDFVAIVGNNGCGKSTLCKALNGLIPHFITGEYSGDVWIDGCNTKDTEIGVLAQKVGYVYQDFENQIIRPTVLDDASYACLNYAMKDYKERGMRALEQCGLKNREHDYIWQLSGGQTHLLALAGAVSLQPDILVLDEPIAQLDPEHADRIYQVLKELNEVYGKTILVIEHHTEYIADYCRHVVLMRDGGVAWKLPSKEALQRVEELQKSNVFPPQVTTAAQRLKERGKYDPLQPLPITIQEGMEVFTPRFIRRNQEAAMAHADRAKTENVISLRDVSLSYRSVKGDPRQVFHNLNLRICRGEKIAFIGSNGAGKSTLMKMMIGLLHPSSGSIALNGRSIQKKKPEELSGEISMVYQNPEDMFIKDSIEKDISYAMDVRGVADRIERTEELLRRFRLWELRERDGRMLSGGQMRRASLAIGIALNPGILLLDEPTANLDIATRKEIMKTLNEMKAITETVIIATHDMQLVCEWADRIVVLCEGRVVADGSREQIFSNREILERVGIRPPEIFSMGQELDPESHCYTIEEFVCRFEGRRAYENHAEVI